VLPRPIVFLAVLGILLLSSVTVFAGSSRFPSTDPNPRVGTPNDPEFDCAEPDDEDAVTACSNVFSEQYRLFGFAPAYTKNTATYHDLQHLQAGEFSQVSGVSADVAWKSTTGRADVAIAILDTGIRWEKDTLRRHIHLNLNELPPPEAANGSTAAGYDENGDGAFNVDDYANDRRVDKSAGANGIAGVIDAEDLIATFSDQQDSDNNGYIDDIAGWDFFDDDNDPFDASSYSSANNHGSGRAEDAAEETDDGQGGAGVCPDCQIMPLRVWDTFVVPADNYATATIYAADNGAAVQEVALGVLQNNKFSKFATQYAFSKGVALMSVSSDLDSSDHNYPTNYNNTIFVAGSVADVEGLGQDNEQFADAFRQFGIGSEGPAETWFRNSNTTQYGGHAGIVMMGTTGSQATGQAAGAAGLIVSRGRELANANGGPLTSNEIKQILTLTAEDVLPENTVGVGIADPAQPGWDQHFGYGRVDLGAAMQLIQPAATTPGGVQHVRIPPEAGIETPAWFAPLDPVTQPTVEIRGFANARRALSYTYTLEYAPGLEPLDAQFKTFAVGTGAGGQNGFLGWMPLSVIARDLPGAAQGIPPLNPYQYAFTVRLRVKDSYGNVGEDRKTLFAYHDPTLHAGWPKNIDTGGESSMRLADLNGDGKQEIIAATSSGELYVWNADGTAYSGFNNGQPWLAPVPAMVQNHLGSRAGSIPLGRGGFTTPAIADITGDGRPEIVVATGDKIFAIQANGQVAFGFPVSLNPAFSSPALKSKTNHVKSGVMSSPVLADLDEDGYLDIVVSALDQRAYAWNGRGQMLPGWPVYLRDPDAAVPAGAESINTPAVADIDGDGHLDVVVPTNEIYKGSAPAPTPAELTDALRRGVLDEALQTAGLVSSRVYAVKHNGTLADGDSSDNTGFTVDRDAFLSGWPVKLGGVADILPLIGPGFDPVIADTDGDGKPEIILGSTLGTMIVFDGAGKAKYPLNPGAAGLAPGATFNLFEYPAVGDTLGAGNLSIYKGGLPAQGLVDLVAVGQNIPYSHVVQGWDARTGATLPGWPRPTDDWQLLSSPSIANVGGGPEREVIVGTGLYLLHAYGPTGADAPGFPKFTGGWLYGVTPVGDIDGDGLLEIANWTREGNVFVWDTTVAVCDGDHEWPGFRHDNLNDGNYGSDGTPPGKILGLTGTALLSNSSLLKWTANGGDGTCGRADHYEIRSSSSPITDASWSSAALIGTKAALPAGSPEVYPLVMLAADQRHIGIRAVDKAGNVSPIVQIARP
jgi:hypothetical protein